MKRQDKNYKTAKPENVGAVYIYTHTHNTFKEKNVIKVGVLEGMPTLAVCKGK